ncbi:MAG: hypothetical protein ABF260_09205 [Flavobacteriaceae bacterium]
MKTIENLLNFSNKVNKLNLESNSINHIIWFDKEYIEEDFTDPYCPQLQSILINAEEKKLKLIIRNLDNAIKNQCDNMNLNLDKYEKDIYWDYSYTKESDNGRLNQRFTVYKLIPNDEKIFKELWLRNLINIISKIIDTIIEITNLEYIKSKKEILNRSDEKPVKNLSDYFINIENKRKKSFFNELGKVFKTEKGKSIKAIMDELKEESLLIIGPREFKSFLEEFRKIFNHDIGTYQSINDPKVIDNITKEPILKRLKPIMIKFKTNETNL